MANSKTLSNKSGNTKRTAVARTKTKNAAFKNDGHRNQGMSPARTNLEGRSELSADARKQWGNQKNKTKSVHRK